MQIVKNGRPPYHMCIKFRRISKNDNMPGGSECTKACARPAGDGKVSKPVTPGRPDAVPPFCIPGPPLSRLHTRGASSLHTWSTGTVTPLVPSFRLLRLPQPAPASGLAPVSRPAPRTLRKPPIAARALPLRRAFESLTMSPVTNHS